MLGAWRNTPATPGGISMMTRWPPSALTAPGWCCSDHWIAFVPHAARWPYEVHCYPVRRVPDLASLRPENARNWPRCSWTSSAVSPGCSTRLRRTSPGGTRRRRGLGARTSRCTWSCSPFAAAATSSSTCAAGAGMDAFANDVIPERAASRLRELDEETVQSHGNAPRPGPQRESRRGRRACCGRLRRATMATRRKACGSRRGGRT